MDLNTYPDKLGATKNEVSHSDNLGNKALFDDVKIMRTEAPKSDIALAPILASPQGIKSLFANTTQFLCLLRLLVNRRHQPRVAETQQVAQLEPTSQPSIVIYSMGDIVNHFY
jgi:hypothetical protein